jgi:hypothetical protein
VNVIAMIEPIPEDQSGNSPGHIEEITVEEETYEAGREALTAKVPEGWRMVNIRRA